MKPELRKEARRLRQEGKAINEIARILGVSKASVSVWVRDIELTEEQKAQLTKQQRSFKAQSAGAQANREKFREFRIAYQEAGRSKAREGSSLHMAGCMLYWAEGTKARTQVNFANSDPNMVRFFMRFLREEVDI
ncbi:MAG: hypothetical protein H0T73_16825, partial [Ardenticatenales bacterium]|nr:hypothetical protein [Ardenticatenales bacterium]